MAGRVGRDAAYPLFEKISNKFNISPSKKSSNRQLLSVVDDALLCWSPEDGCLFSQILDVPTSVVQVRKRTGFCIVCDSSPKCEGQWVLGSCNLYVKRTDALIFFLMCVCVCVCVGRAHASVSVLKPR
ncbi:hypothetical protein E2C01_014742 [Portunus trituberculatus]|uniref:Uncharacterized protein n=1 Tax=Portunus trituberculatus TaxID=210409 RepID=A0A5B7DKW9_PORTR|nr:hypothetical protein [Portunus trituberculatus]